MTYSDLTILISVRIDSPDRLRNIRTLTDCLKQLKGVRIIVLEADNQSKIEQIEGVQKVFIEDNNLLFYHTYYLNILCSMARSEYIGVWDSDVIVPYEQIEQAIKLLREDRADMVYPYNGRCYRVDGDILNEYLSAKDESVLTSNIGKLDCSYGVHTCGGSFFAKRKAYIEAGGDNEKFAGWGPEDLERFKRWEVRGYRVHRIEGVIFHLHHHRGVNSFYLNHELYRSTVRALLETCRETGEYVDIYIPVYIFNLPNRTERKEHILSQFKGRREFKPILVEACQHQIGAVGLWMSIVKVVRMAKMRQDEVIILCKDDHIFTENYSASNFIRNIVGAAEQGCDILMGGIGGFGAAVPIAASRYWVDWFWITQFVVVYANSFDAILDYEFKDTDTADGVFSDIFRHKMTIYPFISRQRDFGYSDITVNNNRENEIDRLFDTASARLNIINKVRNAYNQ